MSKWIFIIIFFLFLLPIQVYGITNLDLINQKVCDRFEDDVTRMAAIMEEVKNRKGITETRVAYGGSDTPIKNADYWVNFVAEAIAFQRAQKYSSSSVLRNSLEVLKNKVLKAKNEIKIVLNE